MSLHGYRTPDGAEYHGRACVRHGMNAIADIHLQLRHRLSRVKCPICFDALPFRLSAIAADEVLVTAPHSVPHPTGATSHIAARISRHYAPPSTPPHAVLPLTSAAFRSVLPLTQYCGTVSIARLGQSYSRLRSLLTVLTPAYSLRQFTPSVSADGFFAPSM